MSMKKGQTTLFVILGLVILIIVTLLLYFKPSVYKQATELGITKTVDSKFKATQIKTYVESCIEEVGKNGVYFISQRGGYFDLPNNYFKAYPPTVYYLIGRKKVLPPVSKIETELSKYVETQLGFCTNKLSIPGITVSFKKPSVTSKIKEDQISISVKMDTTVKRDRSTFKIKEYYSTVKNDRLQKSRLVAEHIINQILEDPTTLCFTCMLSEANKNGFNMVIDNYDDKTYIFKLFGFTESEEKYQLNFVVKV